MHHSYKICHFPLTSLSSLWFFACFRLWNAMILLAILIFWVSDGQFHLVFSQLTSIFRCSGIMIFRPSSSSFVYSWFLYHLRRRRRALRGFLMAKPQTHSHRITHTHTHQKCYGVQAPKHPNGHEVWKIHQVYGHDCTKFELFWLI